MVWCPGCSLQENPDNVEGCPMCYEPPVAAQESPVPASSPITVIRERVEALQRIHANYLAYQADRVRERDHHGAWDVAINLSETECEIAGLEFALRAIGVEA